MHCIRRVAFLGDEMLMELDQLYQELILDHNAHPRNFGSLPDATAEAVGDNPLCGDHIEVQVCMQGDTLRDIRFSGQGCAIAKASASLMTETVRGKTVQQIRRLFELFHTLITQGKEPEDSSLLGKLNALAGVGRFPMKTFVEFANKLDRFLMDFLWKLSITGFTSSFRYKS